jgi:steroid delta-isomerase
MSGDDVEQVLALYASNAVVEDPVGSDAFEGIEAIRGFYTQAISAVSSMELEGKPRVRGNLGACAMVAHPKGAEGVMVAETLDVMSFNDEGKVTSMIAYWGDSNIRVI